MATPYLGEIRIFSWGFAPRGWAFCNGQLLPINQNSALYRLLQTTYGGDGQVNFALPNLQARTPLHTGPGYNLGRAAGEQNHTLASTEVPAHTHAAYATATNASTFDPTGNYLGGVATLLYGPASGSLTPLVSSTVGSAGGGQPHNNLQPYLTLNFCIALVGIYPTQN
jgi:microcystin-dependent protein